MSALIQAGQPFIEILKPQLIAVREPVAVEVEGGSDQGVTQAQLDGVTSTASRSQPNHWHKLPGGPR
jgi:hypothetical protein